MAKKYKDCSDTRKRNKYGYTEAEMKEMINRATIKVGELNNKDEKSYNGTEEKGNG